MWGVYFIDRNHKIGKTEVQFLESELIAAAKQFDRAILLNRNIPTAPTMSAVARATAQAFLADILLILPMLGINAFTKPKFNDAPGEQVQSVADTSGYTVPVDTIVVPAREEGFQETFVGENCWYAIRIGAKYIPKLKYIGAYRVAPVGAITHLAEIAAIEPYGTTGKYLVRFKGVPVAIKPIPRGENCKITMQSARYALRDKLLIARTIDEVWPLSNYVTTTIAHE